MEEIKVLNRFFSRIEKDPHIGISNIGLFATLVSIKEKHKNGDAIQAFSKDVMPLAKISSSATYHKLINDLEQCGYIKYEPLFLREEGA